MLHDFILLSITWDPFYCTHNTHNKQVKNKGRDVSVSAYHIACPIPATAHRAIHTRPHLRSIHVRAEPAILHSAASPMIPKICYIIFVRLPFARSGDGGKASLFISDYLHQPTVVQNHDVSRAHFLPTQPSIYDFLQGFDGYFIIAIVKDYPSRFFRDLL